MTAADKTKMDGVEAGAQVNTVTSVAGKTGVVTLAKADVGLGNVDNTSDATKSVASAVTAGSANVLSTARTINGTSFNGSANITTVNWGTARNITIGSTTISVDGSAAISWTLADIGAQATLVSGTNIKTVNNESLLGSGNITINATSIIAVRTPTPLSPLTGATDVLPFPTLSANAYGNIFSSDTRAHRQFQVDLNTDDFSSPLYDAQQNADSHNVTLQLTPSTLYKWRCRDVAISGATSDWSAVQTFTTGAAYVNTPTFTVTGSPSSVPEQPVLSTA
jgi:hypothetical protein